MAAGPGPNGRWLRFFAQLGYSLLTYKTVRDRYWEGHPAPNLLPVRGDFTHGFRVTSLFEDTAANSLGMPSPEPDSWRPDVAALATELPDRFLTVSVTATLEAGMNDEALYEQFARLAHAVKQAGADAVELNLSCPNIPGHREGALYRDERTCHQVLDHVRARVGSNFPIFLKLGYDADFPRLAAEFQEDPRVGYVAINAVPAAVSTAENTPAFGSARPTAGIGGAALLPHSLRAVRALAAARTARRWSPIIGAGGVTDAKSASQLLEAGADIVTVATAALFDPTLALRIKLGLLRQRQMIAAA